MPAGEAWPSIIGRSRRWRRAVTVISEMALMHRHYLFYIYQALIEARSREARRNVVSASHVPVMPEITRRPMSTSASIARQPTLSREPRMLSGVNRRIKQPIGQWRNGPKSYHGENHHRREVGAIVA